MNANLSTLCLIALLWLGASPAMANCRVLDLVDRIHTLQMRLIISPDTPSFQSDIRLIRRYAGMLDDDMLLDAVDAFGFSRQGMTTMRYSAYVRDLLNQTSIDDIETARRHYQDPSVLNNIESMTGYLDNLRCTAVEIANTPMPEPSVEDFGQGLRDSIREKLDWRIALIGIALITGVILLGRIRSYPQPRDWPSQDVD